MYAEMLITLNPELQLSKLKNGLRNKFFRIALNKAASPLKAGVIARAAVRSGALQKSIRIKTKNYKATDTWVAIVGPKSNFQVKKTGAKPSRYAHLVERRRPFIRPTMESGREAFISDFNSKLAAQIDAILAT